MLLLYYHKCQQYSSRPLTRAEQSTYKVALFQRHELGGTFVLGHVLIVFEDAGAVNRALCIGGLALICELRLVAAG